MESYSAYCPACDIQVEVRQDSVERGVDASRVLCPALGDACQPGECCMYRMSPEQLRRMLEFLPPRPEAAPARGLQGAAELVEICRRRSLGREAGRLREWWAEEKPRR